MEEYIKRDLEDAIKPFLESREIIAVVGSRQCGKTTLVNKILDEVKFKQINRISFEDVRLLQLFEHDLDSFIELHVRGFDLVFIDEVQYSKDSGKKLKFIYDALGTKIIVSGSSALDVSLNSLKYLVGRVLFFELQPFSFHEFLRSKNVRLADLFEKNLKQDSVVFDEHLPEFLVYGGYPRVVMSKSNLEKEKVLEGLFNTYLLKEVKEIMQLSDDFRLVKLVKALALQTGNLVNFNELSAYTEFSYADLKKHLNLLEKTFVCKLIHPFGLNKRSELVKTPKAYFYDSGFRNAVILDYKFERPDSGAVLENFVFTELIKSGLLPKFWRTKSKAEVDFVVEKGHAVIPIEVKTSISPDSLPKSLYGFIEKYEPKNAFIASQKYFKEKKIGECTVHFTKLSSLTSVLKNLP